MNKTEFLHHVKVCSPKDSYFMVSMILNVPSYQHNCFLSFLKWGLPLKETFKIIDIIGKNVPIKDSRYFDEFFILCSKVSNPWLLKDNLAISA